MLIAICPLTLDLGIDILFLTIFALRVDTRVQIEEQEDSWLGRSPIEVSLWFRTYFKSYTYKKGGKKN